MGDGDLVDDLLPRAEEHFKERYRLVAEGYDLGRLSERVGELVRMSPEDIVERGKEKRKVEARSILCFWATDRLGIGQTELAKRLKLTQPAVSQGVRRGRDLARSQSDSLVHDLML